LKMERHKQDKQLYEFGPFRLDTGKHLLTRAGEPVPLPPKVYDTLLVLVESGGHMLEKDEFIKRLWPDSFVEEGSLARNISYLRKALDEAGAGESYIETVPKRGYRFVAPVTLTLSNGVGVKSLVEERHESETPVAGVGLNGKAAELASNGYQHGTAPAELAKPALSAPVESSVVVVAEKSPKLKWLSIAASVLILASLALVFAYFNRSSRSSAETFLSPATLQVTKLTNTGQARFPALSPNGKYLAQVLDDGKRQSLHVRQLETSSSVEIVPPADVNYRGLTFAPDNGSIYYVVYEGSGKLGVLYHIPALGGVAKRISTDIDSPITLSPDGRQLAFIRNAPSRGETSLLVINADGSAERRIATRHRPQPFLLAGPAWSPDGKQIACVVRNLCDGVAVMDVLAFNLGDGAQTQLTKQMPGRRWVTIGQLCWTRSDALLAVAWREPTYTFADQLWLIPTRGAEARQVTNDSNSYTGLSASTDGWRLVTTQFTRASNIYVAPGTSIERGTQIATSLLGNASVNPGLAWLPDGRIVYSSTASGHSDLWVMNADGSSRKPLTDDIHTDLQPVASPDGHTVAFVSWRNGKQGLWQMGLDGSGLRLLANDAGESSHSFSPDGRWIVYDALDAGVPTLWRMPAGGGAAERLTTFYSWKPVVSPDGRWLACYFLESPSASAKIALLPFSTEPVAVAAERPARILGELPARDRPLMQWMPDSQALVYSVTRAGVANLWRQPLDGSPARQITNFTEDRILSFAWSRDGRIVYERGRLMSDTVLLSSR
jgi:Tol biopolymer transport system component/DNA-binding winged helix-turn-helix (wHTH) protein